MLKAENLKKRYGDREVLKGVSLEVPRGKIVGLFGPNGAGKTTTFRCLIGFEKPDGGKVTLDGEDISQLPPYRRAKKGLAFLPQEPSIFEDLSVEENILLFAELLFKDPERAKVQTVELLKDFNLYHLRRSKASSLSGGERRRLEIARLFLRTPKYLLLDEPFAGVDPKQVGELKRLILDIKRRYQSVHPIGILITDHNVWETMKFVDWVVILHEGQMLFTGYPHEAASNPKVRELYLGEDFKL